MWRPAGRLKNPVVVEILANIRQPDTSTSTGWSTLIDPYFISEYIDKTAASQLEKVSEQGSFNEQRYLVYGYYDERITEKCRFLDGTTAYNVIGLDNGDENSEMMRITLVRSESRES